MYTFPFEKLEVWNKSRILTKKIYKVTWKFPDYEKYGLVSQVRRATVSVCSNIAEGSSRNSGKDQTHFYNMAFSSLMETMNQLILSEDLEFLDAKTLSEFRNDIQFISLMLNNLTLYSGRR